MTPSSIRKGAPVFGIAMAALTWGSPALAQTTSVQLEELVVTAQKRAENVQDVPISITAVSGAEIERAHMVNFGQLTTVVPSLQFTTSNNVRNTTIYLRGIGQSGNNPGIESSVGVFIDGAYVPGSSGLFGDLTDIQSVEVLSGPQGTLYGRNTPLGAINIVTREPQAETEAMLTAGYGNYDQTSLKGYLGGALASDLTSRVSFWARKRSGFAYNLATGNHVNDFTGEGGRFRALWKPSDALKLDLAGYYSNVSANDGVADLIDAGGPTGIATPGYLAATAALGYTFQNYGHRDFIVQTQDVTKDKALAYGSSLTGNYEFANGYKLTSITSGDYNKGGGNPYANAGLPQKILILAEMGVINSWSQELRIASPTGRRLEYIAGLYGYRQTYNFDSSVTIGPDANRLLPLPAAAGGPTLFHPGDKEVTSDKLNTASEAVFGTAWFKMTEAWKLEAGGRYVWEHKDGFINHVNLPGANAAFRAAFGPNPVGPVSLTEDKFTWLLSSQYKLTPDVMVFATVSTGWKSGGFNARLTPVGVPVQFNAESSTDYAVGVKSELIDHRIRLNLTAFDTKLMNFQSSILNPVTRTGFITGNAGQRETKGVEGDAVAVVSEHLRLNGAVTYLSAKYTDYTNGPCYSGKVSNGSAPGTCNFNGLTPDRSPALKTNVGADYSRPISDALAIDLRLDVQYTSSMLNDAALDPNTEQKSVTLLNGGIGLKPVNGRWAVNLWARNITDQHYFQFISATPATTLVSTGGVAGGRGYSGYYAEPRTYGVELTIRY